MTDDDERPTEPVPPEVDPDAAYDRMREERHAWVDLFEIGYEAERERRHT